MKIKTHILCSTTFFFLLKSHRLWDNIEKYDGARGAINDVTIWRMQLACWIRKATCADADAHDCRPGHKYSLARERKHTCTHKYVMFIAFCTARIIRERASLLRYTYIACVYECCFLCISGKQHVIISTVCNSTGSCASGEELATKTQDKVRARVLSVTWPWRDYFPAGYSNR